MDFKSKTIPEPRQIVERFNEKYIDNLSRELGLPDSTNVVKFILFFPDLLNFMPYSPEAYQIFEELDICHASQRAIQIFSLRLFFNFEIF
jgi:hypothetical protein